jgi:putative ABC transport system substrate-binding protein
LGNFKKLHFIVYAVGTMLAGLGFSAAAQPTTTLPRIGRLSPSSAAADKPALAGFREGLRQHGWTDKQNIAMEYRFADGKPDRLDQLATELVHLKVDVILSGATIGALAAKRATGTIPIVMVTTDDPVAADLVTSLARPGGNLTGVTALGQELSGKRLQLLKEALPGKSHVAVLSNPTNPDSKLSVKEVEASASELGVKLRVHEIGEPEKFDAAFRTMTAERAGALMVLTDFHVPNAPQADCRAFSSASVGRDVPDQRIYQCGRAYVLRSKLPGHVPPRRRFRREDPQRFKARRLAGTTGYEV